jgi:hypothetical protein
VLLSLPAACNAVNTPPSLTNGSTNSTRPTSCRVYKQGTTAAHTHEVKHTCNHAGDHLAPAWHTASRVTPVRWCGVMAPVPVGLQQLQGPRYGTPVARTTPCRVKPRQPAAGRWQMLLTGGIARDTPPRLPLWGANPETAPGRTLRQDTASSRGQELCCGWRWQQPGAARGRQFLGACMPCSSCCRSVQVAAPQHQRGQAVTARWVLLPNPCTACCWFGRSLIGVTKHHPTPPDRCLLTPP